MWLPHSSSYLHTWLIFPLLAAPSKIAIDSTFLKLSSFPSLPWWHSGYSDALAESQRGVRPCSSSASLLPKYKFYEAETWGIWVTAVTLAPKQYYLRLPPQKKNLRYLLKKYILCIKLILNLKWDKVKFCDIHTYKHKRPIYWWPNACLLIYYILYTHYSV